MKKFIALLVLCCTLLAAPGAGGQVLGLAASARTVGKPCSFHRTLLGNKKTIVCFAHRMNVSASTATTIADRESHYDNTAINWSSMALGLFQHLKRYWDGRVRDAHKALRRWRVLHWSWRNPRAQAVVTFVYVHHHGWGAWTTCC